MHPIMIMLVNFVRAPPAGGAFYAADKKKKCAEKVDNHIIYGLNH